MVKYGLLGHNELCLSASIGYKSESVIIVDRNSLTYGGCALIAIERLHDDRGQALSGLFSPSAELARERWRQMDAEREVLSHGESATWCWLRVGRFRRRGLLGLR